MIWPFTRIAQLEAENAALRRKLGAGGRAAHENARRRQVSTTERLRAEILERTVAQ